MRITLERLSPHAVVPTYGTRGAACADLYAALESKLTLAPGQRALVPTGWAMQLPAGYELQIRPRSGWAYKKGITVLNSPGTIDEDYLPPNEVQVLLINHGHEPVEIERGDRIAQARLAPVEQHDFVELGDAVHLPTLASGSSTIRAGGFGSTGH